MLSEQVHMRHLGQRRSIGLKSHNIPRRSRSAGSDCLHTSGLHTHSSPGCKDSQSITITMATQRATKKGDGAGPVAALPDKTEPEKPKIKPPTTQQTVQMLRFVRARVLRARARGVGVIRYVSASSVDEHTQTHTHTRARAHAHTASRCRHWASLWRASRSCPP